MNTITVLTDTPVMIVTASSFPAGVKLAHETLHEAVPFSTERKYFGLSRPEGGGEIVYHAAAEELHTGEAQQLELKTMTIPKGRYACITIREYMKDVAAIGKAFEELIALPDIDPQGYCVEWYPNNEDLKCLVRLNG